LKFIRLRFKLPSERIRLKLKAASFVRTATGILDPIPQYKATAKLAGFLQSVRKS